ncbi:hypothetical protein FACS1894170_01720 [Planctomycetales bacterium]|nr:hypothetical protein FACS1894170_01720 [Planctomycetales bacterium]
MENNASAKFGFLELCPTDATENGFVGALLVVDQQGVPLEFKCTESIKPNSTQRILYGDKMKSHILAKLCGVPLLGIVTNKPTILFVSQSAFLDIRNEIDIPVLSIERAANTEQIDTNSFSKQSHKSFPNDNDALTTIPFEFELTEPFDRINKAVEVLGKQDTRFQ